MGLAMHSVPLVLWREPGPWVMASSLHSVNRTSLTALVSIVETSGCALFHCFSYISVSYGNHGCQGGNMHNTYLYIISNEGVAREQSYPFKAKVVFAAYVCIPYTGRNKNLTSKFTLHLALHSRHSLV